MKEYYTAQDANEEKRIPDFAKQRNGEIKESVLLMTEFVENNVDAGLQMPPSYPEIVDKNKLTDDEKKAKA